MTDPLLTKQLWLENLGKQQKNWERKIAAVCHVFKKTTWMLGFLFFFEIKKKQMLSVSLFFFHRFLILFLDCTARRQAKPGIFR